MVFWESLGTVINSVNFLGTSIQIVLIAFIFTLSRMITKDQMGEMSLIIMFQLIMARVDEFKYLILILGLYIFIIQMVRLIKVKRQ